MPRRGLTYSADDRRASCNIGVIPGQALIRAGDKPANVAAADLLGCDNVRLYRVHTTLIQTVLHQAVRGMLRTIATIAADNRSAHPGGHACNVTAEPHCFATSPVFLHPACLASFLVFQGCCSSCAILQIFKWRREPSCCQHPF
jgi:hypothetical protein